MAPYSQVSIGRKKARIGQGMAALVQAGEALPSSPLSPPRRALGASIPCTPAPVMPPATHAARLSRACWGSRGARRDAKVTTGKAAKQGRPAVSSHAGPRGVTTVDCPQWGQRWGRQECRTGGEVEDCRGGYTVYFSGLF